MHAAATAFARDCKGMSKPQKSPTLRDRFHQFSRVISNAVGSKYLSKTYLNIASAPDASTATKVIDAVIQLEHTRPIPVDHLTQFSKQIHKNVFASTVLQQLVRDHLRLYSLPERIRQQLVQAFDPKESPAQRLIAHQRKR